MTPLFITGTDTSCGKTVVTAAIMRVLKKNAHRVVGMKPVATGAMVTPQGLRNDDALCLIREASIEMPYEDVNPYCFAPPIAPHLAAAAIQTPIDFARIEQSLYACRQTADIVVVEGVGGWMVPLGPRQWLSDLVGLLALPAILVVGLKLGCINHTMLTVRAINSDKIPLLGWIANHVTSDYTEGAATIDALSERIAAPLLGIVPWQKPPDLALVANILSPAIHTLRA